MAQSKHPVNSRGTQHSIRGHFGRLLFGTVADKYHKLSEAVVELAQNSIDAGAKEVFAGIDFQRSRVVVLDNGSGITEETFGKIFVSVGYSLKAPGSAGRFGFGFFSPVNKCDEYTVSTRPKGGDILQCAMVGKEIREQYDPVIEVVPLDAAPAIPQPLAAHAGALAKGWRTMSVLEGVIRDRTISTINIDELVQQISVKLGQAMAKRGTKKVHLVVTDKQGKVERREVNPLHFTGDPLPLVSYDEPGCGKVVFQLYRASRVGGVTKGLVRLARLGDVSHIAMRSFYTQAMGSGWLNDKATKEALDALASGYFEGVIEIENVTLETGRNVFNLDDAVSYTYLVIGQWWTEHGKALFNEAREERQSHNNHANGTHALDLLYSGLANPWAEDLMPEFEAPVAVETRPDPEPREEGEEPRRTNKKRVIARHPRDPRDAPPRPQDPRNPNKAPARLQFAFDRVPGQSELFMFDWPNFTCAVNIAHPLWEACDEDGGKRTPRHDKQVIQLLCFLGYKLFSVLRRCSDPSEFDSLRWIIDQDLPWYVNGIILLRD